MKDGRRNAREVLHFNRPRCFDKLPCDFGSGPRGRAGVELTRTARA